LRSRPAEAPDSRFPAADKSKLTSWDRVPDEPGSIECTGPIECISAVTLLTADMRKSVQFYSSVGFELLYGGEDADFSSFRAGSGYLNVQLDARRDAHGPIWGRVIFWVDDVDGMHQRVIGTGARPESAPADAPWGERYFHVRDPDGHELSFARPLDRR
jgi:catechol 2,3-dioxygenase-like lactoylglutathione lyase family enzyme